MLSLAAALAATQAGAPPARLDGHYQCEVLGSGDGFMALTSRFYADGNEAGTFGSWSGAEGAGQVQLSIRWQFMLGDPRPYRAYVQFSVPLRRKLAGTRLLNLTRSDFAVRGFMALAAPVTSEAGARRAGAAVDLRTLLDYAGDKTDLAWELIRPEPYSAPIEIGSFGLPRLKEAVKRFEPLLDELNAKRADFRNRCAYSAQSLPED